MFSVFKHLFPIKWFSISFLQCKTPAEQCIFMFTVNHPMQQLLLALANLSFQLDLFVDYNNPLSSFMDLLV